MATPAVSITVQAQSALGPPGARRGCVRDDEPFEGLRRVDAAFDLGWTETTDALERGARSVMSGSSNQAVVPPFEGVAEAAAPSASALSASYQSCDGQRRPPLLSCQ
jgi:hypothetical protein